MALRLCLRARTERSVPTEGSNTRKQAALTSVAVLLTTAANAAAVTSAEIYTNDAYQYGRYSARVQFAPASGVVNRTACNGTFHVYTYEWTPEYIAWSVDGVEIRRETGEVALGFEDNAVEGMQLRFNVWPGDESFGGNFDPAVLPVYEYVDWVEYSSYTYGAFQVEWREDFTADALPSGWSAASWDSPKGLSTHARSNVGFVDGYAVLALTSDEATGTTGANPRATDPGALPVPPTPGTAPATPTPPPATVPASPGTTSAPATTSEPVPGNTAPIPDVPVPAPGGPGPVPPATSVPDATTAAPGASTLGVQPPVAPGPVASTPVVAAPGNSPSSSGCSVQTGPGERGWAGSILIGCALAAFGRRRGRRR